ncbi:hypothetical protein [Streptomyces sp. NPDC013455]|uniref:hypothetical protein n=1 Tax=Streptomyces sp. NPDC013455 TaxID=3155605 RepID=UPI0033E63FD9
MAQDDSLRQAKASLIEQGDKAERKLNWLLRGRLADAIRDRAWNAGRHEQRGMSGWCVACSAGTAPASEHWFVIEITW